MIRLLLIALALVIGCADPAAVSVPSAPPSAASSTPHTFPSGARGLRTGDLLTYTSKPWGFDTNSYFLVGPEGLVMIDTQFLPSATAEAADWAEAETGRKLELAIVLHANPDKFNGAHTLQTRGVRVVTAAAIAEAIPAVHEKRKGWFYDRYAPDYPSDTPALETVTPGPLKVAGLALELYLLGPACSEAQLVARHGAHLFVGDVVANGTHAWLELGHVDAWQARLDELAKLSPAVVHPGRGASGGPELIAAQKRYLGEVARLVRAAVAASPEPREPTEAELTAVREALLTAHPELDYAVFLKLGLPAVWRHYAGP